MKKERLTRLLWVGAVVMALAFAGCGGGDDSDENGSTDHGSNTNEDGGTSEDAGGGTVTGTGAVWVDEEALSAVLSDTAINLSVPLKAKSESKKYVATLEGWLTKLETGETVGQSAKKEDLSVENGSLTTSLSLSVPAELVKKGDAGDYVITLKVTNSKGESQTFKRSLFNALQMSEAIVLSTDTFYSGGKSYMRVLVRDPKTGAPTKGATVNVTIKGLNGVDYASMGVTDDFGLGKILIDFDTQFTGGAEMDVQVRTANSTESVVRPIQIVREHRVLLTSDKPLYQPGQTMHLRVLSLKRPSLEAEGGTDCTIEVMDAKGNKVFKKAVKTNDYGIASATFKLAREINMGDYTLRATVGDVETEKTVNVSRYVLPKFKVSFTADKTFYKPKDHVKGNLSAQYFFGKSVSKGTYHIEIQKYDIGFETFATLDGSLDTDGKADIDFDLPEYLIGEPLLEGNAFVSLNITVQDTAGQKVSMSKMVPVVQSSLLPFMISEMKYPVQGLPNRFFLIVTDPMGNLVKSHYKVTGFDGKAIEGETDDFGVAVVELTVPVLENQSSGTPNGPNDGDVMDEQVPAEGEWEGGGGNTTSSYSWSATVEVSAASGEMATREFGFTAGSPQLAQVILRTDRALYKVGDTINMDFLASGGLTGRIFLDVIKNNQTLLSDAFDLENGRGAGALDLSNDMTGTLELFAYYIGASGDIVRATRLVQVEDASDLNIAVKADKEIYRPAEESKISFKITDKNSAAVQAALGIYIVDEAVYALQENQPGLLKLFFKLEEELLKPRTEVHGFSQEELLNDSEPSDHRERAAEVLLAASDAEASYGVNANTYQEASSTAQEYVKTRVKADKDTFVSEVGKAYEQGSISEAELPQFAMTAISRFEDPFGNPYALVAGCYSSDYTHLIFIDSRDYENTKHNCDNLYIEYYWFVSAGMDEVFAENVQDTNTDDVAIQMYSWDLTRSSAYDEGDMEGGGGGWNGDDDGAQDAGAVAPGEGEGEGEPTGEGDTPKENDQSVRIRKYFPETLYVNSALITDEQGNAEISVPLADSITTWRLTALASSKIGQLGSALTGITVFQDFFVDIDFPVSLTQGDEVSVPVVVYNYLKEKQDVTLTATQESWFEALGALSKTVSLESEQVASFYFPIRVKELGTHTFTVVAQGTSQSDGVARTVAVEPNGEPQYIVYSGGLKGEVNHTVTFPPEAIPGANKLQVKIYPGIFSQVVEGLDSIFNMPSGCFEQTSSSTYPNILALKYMRDTDQITPEIEVKALEYIAQGYQRLLSYEVDGGGFEWFGQAPAHIILTAYGLLEFSDMSKVYEVDPNIISRTQAWLVSKQKGDGSWEPQSGGIAEGAINNFQDSVLRNTAYVAWALIESGYTGASVQSAVSYLKTNISKATDNYTRAIIANALIAFRNDDPEGAALLNELDEARINDGDKSYWEQTQATESYSYGDVANLETTALIAYAMIRAGGYRDAIEGALEYIAGSKDQFGNWSSTQATIYSLRTMIASLESASSPTNAKVSVYVNGNLVQTYDITTADSDVLRQLDFANDELYPENNVRITIEGEGKLMYQVTGTYYAPWENGGGEPTGPLAVTVTYDKTTLAVDDQILVTVNVSATDPSVSADMVIVDLGIPPGFEVVTDDLDLNIANNPVFTKYEIAGRQIIVYLYKVTYADPVNFSYHIEAKFPVKAATPPADAYPYYNPEDKATSEAGEVTVTE